MLLVFCLFSPLYPCVACCERGSRQLQAGRRKEAAFRAPFSFRRRVVCVCCCCACCMHARAREKKENNEVTPWVNERGWVLSISSRRGIEHQTSGHLRLPAPGA